MDSGKWSEEIIRVQCYPKSYPKYPTRIDAPRTRFQAQTSSKPSPWQLVAAILDILALSSQFV
jgi:hypothetical protein